MVLLLQFADMDAMWAFRAALGKVAGLPAGKHNTRRWKMPDGTVLVAVPDALAGAARAIGLGTELDPFKTDLTETPEIEAEVPGYDALADVEKYLVKAKMTRRTFERRGIE